MNVQENTMLQGLQGGTMDTLGCGDRVSVRPSGIHGVVHAIAKDVVYIRLEKGEVITALPGEVDFIPTCCKCGAELPVIGDVCAACGEEQIPFWDKPKEVETWQG
jgi:hypothetical protein